MLLVVNPPITPITPISNATSPIPSIHPRDERTYAIIGAAQKVHRVLGCGFLERVYQEALAIELRRCGIPTAREVELPIDYEGERLACTYRVDFLCYDNVVVELKALSRTSGIEEAQVLNYLKAGGFEVGLLLNFGAKIAGDATLRIILAMNACAPSDLSHWNIIGVIGVIGG